MHYKLSKIIELGPNSVAGKVFDEQGNLAGAHISSDEWWLEVDLLKDVGFDKQKDTYEKDW
jgi:hypothetical protein